MISKLGPGWLGLVLASLIAAYMSTIGTHLNWGSSYAVNDFYQRFVNPKASQKELVRVGRICTILLMVLAGTLALTVLEDATGAFNLLLLAGAGSGAIYLLRWFWWRINAISEISAMIVTTIVAVALTAMSKNESVQEWQWGVLGWDSLKFLIAVGATTLTWLLATFLTRPEDEETLRNFYRKVQPGGPGWAKLVNKARKDGVNLGDEGKPWHLPTEILCVFVGMVMIYSSLFSIGSFVYGNIGWGISLAVVAAASCFALFALFHRTLTR